MINVYISSPSMTPEEVEFKVSKFPCGESLICVKRSSMVELLGTAYMNDKVLHFIFNWDSNDDLIELMLMVDAINAINPTVKKLLTIAYFPYGRQDRVSNYGEPHSARVVCKMINSCGFDTVQVLDPHSDVIEALIDNVQVITQDQMFMRYFENNGFHYMGVVSPDGGAYKKVSKFAKRIAEDVNEKVKVIRADKVRDTITGNITDIEVYAKNSEIHGHTVMILDDICDGGGTFVGLAKELKKKGAVKVDLYVTHGMFTKGVDILLKHIDEIYTVSYNGPEEDINKVNIISMKGE